MWPYLLEKAWCKQIGSYEKAKGLSPEDAFEEITGIPSYSYPIAHMSHETLKKNLKSWIQKSYWICLTGKNETKDIENRQVFFIEEMNDENSFLIRSSYLKFKLKGHKNHETKRIPISLEEIIKLFEYVTVGYVINSNSPLSYPHTSKKRQDKFYELRVLEEEIINIRYIQFYSDYLQIADGYPYSPIFMELYNSDHELLYQGCPKSIAGHRSSRKNLFNEDLTSDILMKLKPGLYYFRIEVDWKIPDVISSGNIVIYCKDTKLVETRAECKLFKVCRSSIIINH